MKQFLTLFNILKTAITSILILTFPDIIILFYVEVDSSNYVIGVAFLSHTNLTVFIICSG